MMEGFGKDDIGASADADRAGHEPGLSTRPGHTVAIPSAGNAGPDWFEVAKALANAIMFQRGTRPEHTVGRDGRARIGIVDLFGCYCVDDAAREFCELAGLPFESLPAPNEHQAYYMAATGREWADWFTDRDAIILEAGPSPGRGKVDMKALAQAIEARQRQDAETGLARKGESAVAESDAPNPPKDTPNGNR